MGEIEDSYWCELFRRKFISDFYCNYSINCPVELKPYNDQHYPTRLLTTDRVPPWGWVKIFRKKADFRAQMVLTRQRKEILWYQCLKRVRWGWKYSPWPNKHQIWAFRIAVQERTVIVMLLFCSVDLVKSVNGPLCLWQCFIFPVLLKSKVLKPRLIFKALWICHASCQY